MGELLKVGWDLFTIRHYKRQGMSLSAGDYVVAIGYVIFLYATGVSAATVFLSKTIHSTNGCSSRPSSLTES